MLRGGPGLLPTEARRSLTLEHTPEGDNAALPAVNLGARPVGFSSCRPLCSGETGHNEVSAAEYLST